MVFVFHMLYIHYRRDLAHTIRAINLDCCLNVIVFFFAMERFMFYDNRGFPYPIWHIITK